MSTNEKPSSTICGLQFENLPKMETVQEKFEFCTDVKFDFERRKWTDERALEGSDFVQKWENKFEQLWQNNKVLWPRQPYQPDIVVLNYPVFQKKNQQLTITLESFGLLQAERTDKFFYKCLNHNDIKLEIYQEALKDCEKSNSSLQTYLNQVGFQIRL